MLPYRVADAARSDLAAILATSLERWGESGRDRYEALIDAAMQRIVHAPKGPMTRDRGELGPGTRSFHLRHARHGQGIHEPVHVIYFRVLAKLIVVDRVIHERMEPAQHIQPARTRRRKRPQPRSR